MMDAATGPVFAITAVEEEEPDYGLILVDEECPVEHDEIPGPPSLYCSEKDATFNGKRVGTTVSRFLNASIGNSNSNGGLQKSTSSSETKKGSLSNSINPKIHKRFISAPHLKQLEVQAKKSTSSKDEMDLSDTEHRWSGQGILASRADLELPFDQFAAGCNLLQAAAKGDLDEVKLILAAGKTHVNFRDYDRRTALHVAASEGHLTVCQYLIEHKGARINRSDRWGGSPLDDAHRHRRSEIIHFLRKHGATTGSGNRSINLIAAAAEGDVDEVKTLLQIGDSQQQKLNINKGDYDKRTALHLAAGEGHVDIVRILCEAGADVNVEDRWSRRPMDDAISGSHEECISVLESYGAAPGSIRPAPEVSIDDSDKRVVDNMEVNFDELDLIDRIGSGAFGEIYKCRWRGTLVAAKIIKSAKIRNDWLNKRMLEKIKEGDDVSTCIKEMDDAEIELDQSEKDEAIADFRREISVLKSLRHPHIVLLLAYSTTANHECLISELMKCSLLDVFKAHIVQGTKMNHRQQIAYATQLALGMNYLHTCKPPVVHRDLKPANLLIDHSGVLKISDFGLSKIRPDPSKKETEKYVMTGETGSYRFMAPECFRHEEYNETVDVYSFAMILFYLLVGRPPWPNLSGIDAVKRASEDGDRPNIPRDMDVRMSNMLKECWNENPSLRPSFQQIVDTFNEYNQNVFKLKSSDAVYSSPDASSNCCVIL